MNILIDALPNTVNINGAPWPIVANWRDCLRTILAFEDPELTQQEKQAVLLSNLYAEIPPDIEQATKQAVWFLNGGRDEKDDAPSMRLFSFEKDSGFIFAAFRQTHGIDLESAEFHWWKFLTLFMDIGQDTTFSQLVAFRKRIKTGKATKEERETAREMGDLLDVPEVDDLTLEERDAIAQFEKLIGIR